MATFWTGSSVAAVATEVSRAWSWLETEADRLEVPQSKIINAIKECGWLKSEIEALDPNKTRRLRRAPETKNRRSMLIKYRERQADVW